MHDDGDWDSEVGEGLIEVAAEIGWVGWFTIVVLLTGIGLLVWHLWGG